MLPTAHYYMSHKGGDSCVAVHVLFVLFAYFPWETHESKTAGQYMKSSDIQITFYKGWTNVIFLPAIMEDQIIHILINDCIWEEKSKWKW